MIPGTSYSPSKAFIGFAREFFDHLAGGDYGSALRKLDGTATRWTKKQLQSLIDSATNGVGLCPCSGLTKSASPSVEEVSAGIYVLSHRLPVDGKWGPAVFRLSQKEGTEYFHVELQAIER
jgi:hypothetical protein